MNGPSESLDLFGIQVIYHLKTRTVAFEVGPVSMQATRYPVENALVADKLNLPPVTVKDEKCQVSVESFGRP